MTHQVLQVYVSLLPVDSDVQFVSLEHLGDRVVTEHLLQHLYHALLEQYCTTITFKYSQI